MRFGKFLTAAMAATSILVLTGCANEASLSGETNTTEVTAIDQTNLVTVGQKAIDELLSRETFMMYEVGDVQALHYAEAAAMYGAAKFAGLTQDETRLDGVTARFERTKTEKLPNTANHVDANVVAIVPLELYLQGGPESYREEGLILADGQWEDPREDGLTNQTRFWIDDVWMIGSLQMQAYRATGDTIYLDRAAHETVAYLDRLQQPNGLFHHGPDAPFFWGRGNGWVAAGLAEVMSELPEDHPDNARVREGYVLMMEALLNYQAEDGMWRQLIDDPDAWKETSATAMFGFAMASGVNAGLLDEETYGPSARNAWNALQDYLTEDGRLTEVCVGTGQSDDADYYLNRPRAVGDFHAQAPLLWFASALIEG